MIITKENYQELLQGTTIVEVSGEGCANCITLLPVLNKILKNRNDVVLHHIEVSEENYFFIEKFNVEAVPTILILNGMEVVGKCRGYQPEEILELWIDAKIEEINKKIQ